MSTSKKQIASGFVWTGLQLVINQGFAFVIRIVLAKFLYPEEFGLVGMAVVFTGFVQVLNDLGIASALVQKKKEDLSEIHYYTAFWTGVIWSVTLYVLISFIISPLAAHFYSEPKLELLIPVLSLGILSSPVNMIHKAQLTKRLNFKRIAIIDNIANVSAGVLALILAFVGAGVWSLAFNSVASILIAMPLYFSATKWLPKMVWEKRAFLDVFNFGMYTTGTNVVNYWMQNIDYMLVGKFVGAASLGLYSLAFVLTDMFRMRLMAVVNNVMFPVFSQHQEDRSRILMFFKKTIFYNCAISFPFMVVLIFLGEDLIITLFGDKWKGLGLTLQILAGSVMFHMMTSGNNALIRALGKPQIEFKVQLIKSLIYIPMLIYFVIQYGIIGAAWVVLFNKILAIFFAQYSLNKVMGMNLNMILFREVATPMIASIIAAATIMLSKGYNFNVFFLASMVFLVYTLSLLIIRKDIYNEIRKIVLK